MKRDNYIRKELKKKVDDETIIYAGYVVSSKGTIFNKYNNKINVSKEKGTIRLNIEKKPQVLKGGRFIYELFKDVVLTSSEVIVFKDGDQTNIALDNLEVLTRKDYFKNHKWGYKIKKNVQKKIKKEYKNGKNKGVTIHKLAVKYDCCDITIWKILNDSYEKGEINEKN